MNETCDRLDGGAEGWRRLGGGGVPRTVVGVCLGIITRNFGVTLKKRAGTLNVLLWTKLLSSTCTVTGYFLLLCCFTVTLGNEDRFPKLSIFE